MNWIRKNKKRCLLGIAAINILVMGLSSYWILSRKLEIDSGQMGSNGKTRNIEVTEPPSLPSFSFLWENHFFSRLNLPKQTVLPATANITPPFTVVSILVCSDQKKSSVTLENNKIRTVLSVGESYHGFQLQSVETGKAVFRKGTGQVDVFLETNVST